MSTQPVKGRALPVVKTPAQRKKDIARAARAAAEKAAADDLAVQKTVADAAAARTAQVANLLIAGHSFASIGAAIGASADEVERMITTDTARYVRSQPSLRLWVRNYLSGKYADLLEAVWDEATDKNHREKLEHQDRALRILKEMKDLHGAAAPTQTEVSIEAAPDAVEALVAALSAQQGMGYDTNIFDTVPGEVVHQAAEAAHEAEAVSGNALGQPQPDDKDIGS